MTIGLDHYLILSAILFSIGLYGALAKHNAIVILMSIEIMLSATNIAFVAFSRFIVPTDLTGQIFALFAMAIAAAEICGRSGNYYCYLSKKETIDANKIDLMKW